MPPPGSVPSEDRREASAGGTLCESMCEGAAPLVLTAHGASAVENFKRHVLGYADVATQWALVAETAAKHPDSCPLLHILAADYYVASSGFFNPRACESLARARKILENLKADLQSSPWILTNLYLKAFEAWKGGDLKASFEEFSAILDFEPTDLYALKRAQLLAFLRGDVESLLSIALNVKPECEGLPYYHGMLGFALEQNGQLDAALLEGQRGVRILREDAWSQHAVAHCLYFQGELEGVVEWLASFRESWEPLTPFMRTHNHWHMALCLLDQCRYDELEQTFEKELWRASDRGNFEVRLGAAGILWKAEIHAEMFRSHSSASPGAWKDVREKARLSGEWALSNMSKMEKFHDDPESLAGYALYQLLALRVICALPGRLEEAQRCLDSIRSFVKKASPAVAEVYLPLAEAIWSVYGEEKPDWKAARASLSGLIAQFAVCCSPEEPNSPPQARCTPCPFDGEEEEEEEPATSAEPPKCHFMPSGALAPIGGSGEQREVFLEFVWLVAVRAHEAKASERLNRRSSAQDEDAKAQCLEQNDPFSCPVKALDSLRECVVRSHFSRTPAALSLLSEGLLQLSGEFLQKSLFLVEQSSDR